jgi:RND family efflux transporter MFP subunit
MKESPDMSEVHHSPVSEAQRRTVLKRTGGIVLLVLILLGVGAAVRIAMRTTQAHQLDANVRNTAKQYVTVIRAKSTSGTKHIELPGTLQGFIESPIYARSNGYLLHWYKDIGSRVKKGDLLADIDTPEVDKQLSQATANSRQIAANLALAKTSMDRWEQMRQRDVVSQQELDERRSAYTQLEASLAASDAEVKRLQNLVSFKQVLAPFDGLVTRRNVDVGDLIVPGDGNSSKALFVMSQTTPLRIYINVPQSYANTVKVGQSVAISQPELQEKIFHGKIERSAGAIDTSTRTMQIEVLLPNADNQLLPGAYVKVDLPIGDAKTLTIPSNALLFRSEGPRVAVVSQENKVHLSKISIGQDFGNTLEILQGINPDDRIILNPPDSLAEGDPVVAIDKKDQETPAK